MDEEALWELFHSLPPPWNSLEILNQNQFLSVDQNLLTMANLGGNNLKTIMHKGDACCQSAFHFEEKGTKLH